MAGEKAPGSVATPGSFMFLSERCSLDDIPYTIYLKKGGTGSVAEGSISAKWTGTG